MVRFITITLLMLVFTLPVQAGATGVLVGELEDQQQFQTALSPQTSVMILEPRESGTRVTFELRMHPAAQGGQTPVVLDIAPTDFKNWRNPAAMKIEINRRAGIFDGLFLRINAMRVDAQQQKMVNDHTEDIIYWPWKKHEVDALIKAGHQPQSWHDRWLRAQLDVTATSVIFYLDGRLIHQWPRSEGESQGMAVLHLHQGDALRGLTTTALNHQSQFQMVDLSFLATALPEQQVKAPESRVPFSLVDEGKKVLDLKDACWIEQPQDPQNFYEQYDGGPLLPNDTRQPMLRLPKADYTVAHLLVNVNADPSFTNSLTVRMGRYGMGGQTFQRDKEVALPRDSDSNQWKVIRVPLAEVVAQDVLGSFIDVELTKQLRLTRHLPDPNRFRYRPLGLPSAVRIAAITFEKSPLQMRVYSDESGHAFVEPAKPVFKFDLSNITEQNQSYTLKVLTTHLNGQQTIARHEGELQAGRSETVEMAVPVLLRGYHDMTAELFDASGELLLRRTTSFALLPADNRQHRDSSPFGTWEWFGGHVTSRDSDLVGSLFKKLGFRYGMSRHEQASREKWGVRYGFEPTLDPGLVALEQSRAKNSDMRSTVLMFHENSISGPQVTRVPDLFHDRPAYELNENEQKRFDKMWDDALLSTRAVRDKYPEYRISLGNGPLPTKEALYKRKFPSELFDFAGNEPGSFHRLPETQPPDYVAHNASMWMDRQMLDAYGYKDKPIHQCYEIGYPGDNPGNHSSRTQADYFVRIALHSMMWKMDFIHLGGLMNVGNSYYFSNWGSSAFCRAIPEVNVKPAFVAMATLTRVLDGASYLKAHETGSASTYALEFERKDGKRVLAYWTLRGRRPIQIRVNSKTTWQVVDDQANEHPFDGSVMASPTVHYLLGEGNITSVTSGSPIYSDTPPADAAIIAPLDSLDQWREIDERSFELETYDFMTPRRMGDFSFTIARADQQNVLRIEPRPIPKGKATMPMYERLALKHPVQLPGQPNEIGVWINGNSGWGRVIYELKDAKGQRWINIGAAQAAEPHPWMLDWMRAEDIKPDGEAKESDWNTDDAYGLSRINFDGWRYVAFPLPGNYPGEKHPWPGTCNWRWDGDGVVAYPLTLTGIAVVIPEKVLYLDTFAPVKNQTIEMKDISVGWHARWLEDQ